MIVVIDTNVIISGIFWKGAPYKILELWIDGIFEFVATKEIIEEYIRVLEQIGLQYNRRDLSEYWITFIFQNVKLIESRVEFRKCRDPHDNKFIECALSANATAIISGDKDLLALKYVGLIPILSPKEAIAFYKNLYKIKNLK